VEITALYRLNGREVLKISSIGQLFEDADPKYFGVMFNPRLPDGDRLRDEPSREVMGRVVHGELRKLGSAKIAEPETNTIRNATQEEIDAWEQCEAEDDQSLDAEQARIEVESHPVISRLVASMSRLMAENMSMQNRSLNQVMASSLGARAVENLLPEDVPAADILQRIRDDIRVEDAPPRRSR
jgi:hypothetical protein